MVHFLHRITFQRISPISYRKSWVRHLERVLIPYKVSIKENPFNMFSFYQITATIQALRGLASGITIKCSHFCGEYIFCWAMPMEVKYVSPLANFCFSIRATTMNHVFLLFPQKLNMLYVI